MICAIDPISMAHKWRKGACAITSARLAKKLMAHWRVISLFITARQWRMAHLAPGLATCHIERLKTPPHGRCPEGRERGVSR